MTKCDICYPTEIEYKVKFVGDENLGMYPHVVNHLEKNQQLVSQNNHIMTIKESAIPNIVDFINDHMDNTQISFSIDNDNWKPITEISTVIGSKWIDQIITKQQLTNFVQPIVDRNEQIYGYEMLARFKQEGDELIPPFEVFQAAKSRNRMYALDRVCRMTAVRNSFKIQSKVFINFIPTAIYSPEHCLKSTVQLAQTLGIDPAKFVFEVVETEQVDDLKHLKKILMYYREKGFEYALDDVGEGFSTQEVLEDLKPNYMKLDMKYVQGVALSTEKQQTAKNFLNAAKRVGAIPLAEGVEEIEDFHWLKKEGYELFQGYLFGKPGPIH